MSFFVYVIQGTNSDYLHRGHCRDLDERLEQYNTSPLPKLKKYAPYKLLYYETFEGRIAAIRRERFFKTAKGRKFLKERLGLK